MFNTERHLDARQARRMAAEDKFISRLEELEALAGQLVGEIIKNGCAVFYINVKSSRGHMTGRTREFISKYAAIDYLIRNKYV